MRILPYVVILLWCIFAVMFYFLVIGKIPSINPDYIVKAVASLFLIDIVLTIFMAIKYRIKQIKIEKNERQIDY